MADAFDWSQFLDVAAFCLNWQGASPSREALDRTAVGRAYYAAFCTAAGIVRDKGWYIPRGVAEDHPRVRAALRDNQCDRAAGFLKRLCDWRRICDYENSDGADFVAMASSAVQDARAAIRELPSAGRW
jgi:hypothetical protein